MVANASLLNKERGFLGDVVLFCREIMIPVSILPRLIDKATPLEPEVRPALD